MKKVLAILMVMCLFIGLMGCSSTSPLEDQPADTNEATNTPNDQDTSEGDAEEGNPYKIACLTKGLENPFWSMVVAGIEQRAAEIADEIGEENIQVDVFPMDSQTNFEQQVSQMEDAINAGYQAIVICPADGVTVIPAVEKAMEQGIYVIAFESPIETDNITSYVSGNQAIGCEQTAEYLAQKIGGAGEIGIIRGQQGSSIETIRYEAFTGYLAEHYPDVEIVYEAFADWTAEKASAAMEDCLSAHPNVKGVFTECDAMGGAAVQICIANGRTDVVIVSSDGNLEQLRQVKAGQLASTVSLDPMNIGYLGVDTAYRALCGEEVPATVDVPTIFCTQDENVDEEIAKWESQGF